MAAPPPTLPASYGFTKITYEPLDPGSKHPSIRLAILRPAPREATIRMTLVHTKFASKPKYEALSYTWGSPDVVRSIELNGSPVSIRKNLWSALINLRDATEERVLWIDAICINQADVEERNSQVQLMAYIFSRAKEVIVWLGGNDPGSADMMAEEIVARKFNPYALKAFCSKPYWRRVWIVQEVVAATELQVHWEDGSVSWDAFFEWMVHYEDYLDGDFHALQLYIQRRGRFRDDFLLANLMEICKESLCEEPRDKVYGYVGIAHDCQDGNFPVDYSKSLFELYEDVVRHQYRSVKLNAKTIVHFSQLAQRLLGGPLAMSQDLARIQPGKPFPLSAPQSIKDKLNILRVTGVFGGRISIVGPPYDEIVGIPQITQSWKVAISNCKADLEKLRKKNEGFMRMLLNLDSSDLLKICPIDPQYSWRRSKKIWEILNEKYSMSKSESELIPDFKFGPVSEEAKDGSWSWQQPRLFATQDGIIGLIPPNTREGDLLFQFWDSDAVAVVRLDGSYHMRIIGKAVIANDEYQASSKFLAPMDVLDTHRETGLNFDTGLDLYIDIRTLQLMTQ